MGSDTSLVPLPAWNRPPFEAAAVRRRTLDLRDGTLRTELETPDGAATLLAFATLARPGTGVLVADAPAPGVARGGPHVLDAVHGAGRVAIAGAERVVRQAAARARLERLVAHVTDPRGRVRPEAAAEALRGGRAAGRRAPAGRAAQRLGAALGGRRRAHRGRPGAAAGGPLLPLPPDGRRSPTARRPRSAPRGSAAPATAATCSGTPTSSCCPSWPRRTRPPPAPWSGTGRAASTPRGPPPPRRDHDGARFPWESAGSGEDVTPRRLLDQHGRWSTCCTGQQEEHITADVAWAAARYRAWSGDAAPRRRRARSSPRRRATGPRASVSTRPAARTWTA